MRSTGWICLTPGLQELVLSQFLSWVASQLVVHNPKHRPYITDNSLIYLRYSASLSLYIYTDIHTVQYNYPDNIIISGCWRVISHLNKSFVGEGGGSSPGFSVAFCRDFAQIPSQLQNAPEFSAILQVGVQWFSDGWKKSPVSSRGWLCHALPIHVYVHVCRSIMS